MNEHHMKYWGGVKDKAEECVEHILAEGNTPFTLHDAIGKHSLESGEDWDELIEFCKERKCACDDLNRIYRAQVSWIQAHNELEYKKLYP